MEALGLIATQSFDVLITDLHMPEPGDGFAVVTAMRHLQPEAMTLVTSDYPDVKKALNAILLQADEVLVKPFDGKQLASLLAKRRLTFDPSPKPAKENGGSEKRPRLFSPRILESGPVVYLELATRKYSPAGKKSKKRFWPCS